VSRKKDMEGAGRSDSARSFLKLERLIRDPVIRETASALNGIEAYLVGGSLRNLALSVPVVPDYDFAVKGDTRALAERIAERLGGTPFALDVEAGAYRVAAKRDGKALTLDLTPLKGSIEEDLSKRDFTVNAMAVELSSLLSASGPLIDPLGGIDDAGAMLLRMASSSAFDEDPLRMLRAIRLSRQYGLEITPETFEAIKEKAGIIIRVSAERVRDEIRELFIARGTAEAIETLYSTGLVDAIMPEIQGWADVNGYDLRAHSLAVLRESEKLLSDLSEETFPGFSERLKGYFAGEDGQLPRNCLFKLAAFFHDFGKPYAMSRVEGRLRFIGHDTKGSLLVKELMLRMRFSKRTANEVSFLVRNHHRVFMLATLKEPSFRAKGHFFRASGDDGGIMLLALALADARATRGGEDPELYSLALEMLSFYYGTYTRKKPSPILTGREIMDTFGVGEGPAVGEIINEINAGVESGLIKNRKEALRHIREWLKKKGA